MAHLHRAGGRFITVLPRTRTEDARCRAYLVDQAVDWQVLCERPPRRRHPGHAGIHPARPDEETGHRPALSAAAALAKPKHLGYLEHLPTIHREQGFSVRVYPADHLPPHVHLVKAGTGVKIRLAGPSGRPEIVAVYGMQEQDVVAAYRIVEGHLAAFLTAWKDYHGHPASD